MTEEQEDSLADVPILPASVPVTMPDLPIQHRITTAQEFKAFTDPLRKKVLDIVRHQPATAKQLADRLGVSPGAMGHHMKVLEEAGLVQVVARRITRGIVAKYYTRTARIFMYDLPPELAVHASLEIMNHARDEWAEALETNGDDELDNCSFPHMRLSPERAAFYSKRINTLVEDFLNETADPNGLVYGLAAAFFQSPPYIQQAFTPSDAEAE